MKQDIIENILQKIDNFETRLQELEGKNSSQSGDGMTLKTANSRKPNRQRLDLETPVKKLLEEGFFNDWKTDNEVVVKFKQQVLNPKRASLSNVLRRLASPKRGLLMREGEGTKKSPWRYRER